MLSQETKYDFALFVSDTFREFQAVAANRVKFTVLWFVTPCR